MFHIQSHMTYWVLQNEMYVCMYVFAFEVQHPFFGWGEGAMIKVKQLLNYKGKW